MSKMRSKSKKETSANKEPIKADHNLRPLLAATRVSASTSSKEASRSSRTEDPKLSPKVVRGRQSRSDGGRGRRVRDHSLGLRNYGNNCYVNSIVQCLFAIEEIRLMEVSDSTSEFIKIFKHLLEDMGSEKLHLVEPSKFLNQIRKVTKRFANYKQQDAHSFLVFLIKEIDENFAKLSSNYKGLFSVTVETSFEYFCSKNHKKNLIEVIKTFVLPCNENIENTIKDYYLKYKEFTEEMFCSECQMVTTGKMTSRLTGLPSYLVILFSRFDLRRSLKDSFATQFPLSMTLENERIKRKFQLFAVCSHHGSMVSYGHFTARVMNKEAAWYHYNDERVSLSGPPSDRESKETAYILFYRFIHGSTNQGGSKRSISVITQQLRHKQEKVFGCGRSNPMPTMEVQRSPLLATSKDTARGRQLEASAPKNRRARSHSVGLRNTESNDYVNSIVQCLFAIKLIRNLEVADHGSEFIKSFKKLVIDMGSGQSNNVNPKMFLECIQTITNKFANYRQQDAHSFLMYLIKEIDENLSWDFKGLFAGKIQRKSKYFCLKRWQHSTDSVDDINTFILPCDKNVMESFQDLYLFQAENEQMFCSECQRIVNGYTTSKWNRFPCYLIILLRRFDLTGRRDLSETQFPLAMNFGSGNCHFKLFAICDHHGPLTRGHYTARVLDKTENQWYCYDDERCSPTKAPNIGGSEICKSSTAYILFYENV